MITKKNKLSYIFYYLWSVFYRVYPYIAYVFSKHILFQGAKNKGDKSTSISRSNFTKKYFIYGGLMANEKIIKQGYSAYINDYKIAFSLKGPSRLEPSFALLHHELGEQAWGVMVELTDDEWHHIARHEVMYQLITVSVTTAVDHQQHLVSVLMAKESVSSSEAILPSARYVKLLRVGAERFALPVEVQRYYKKCETRASSLSLLFYWLMPMVKRLTPFLGFNRAWWVASISVAVLALASSWLMMFYILQVLGVGK
ncbi:gamma-glutamylcyclotransferase [Piscirickettsia salmonis]|uniref:gamma-glutamylcyclotransferase n=1 Tax=Piscirickettsia salmonis TaxID=1238 RepID=UPI003A7FBE3E